MFLKLNVAGTSFKILPNKVDRYPASRLGRLAALKSPDDGYLIGLCDAFLPETGEFYFDRPLRLFEAILGFYQTGKIHRPLIDCPRAFEEEIDFWGLPRAAKCTDCKRAKLGRDDGHDSDDDVVSTFSWQSVPKLMETADDFDTISVAPKRQIRCTRGSYNNLRARVWDVTEDPASGRFALGFCIFSVLLIFGTVVMMILESLPNFQTHVCLDSVNVTAVLLSNGTSGIPSFNLSDCDFKEKKAVRPLEIADMTCIIWFTVEFLVKLWAAPNPCKYLKHPMSIIDIVAIVPFYLEQLMMLLGTGNGAAHNVQKSVQSGRTLRIFRVFRALRVLKLARYSQDIQLLAVALRRSVTELAMIVVYMLFATFMYSTVLYQVEGEAENTFYPTIPKAAWWTIVSATLFTFSDAPPKTVMGSVVASTGFIAGVLLVAFPVTILVDKFGQIYEERRQKQKKAMSAFSSAAISVASKTTG